MRKCGRLPLFSRLLRGLSLAAAGAVVRWGVVAAAPVLSFCASNKTAAAAYAAAVAYAAAAAAAYAAAAADNNVLMWRGV